MVELVPELDQGNSTPLTLPNGRAAMTAWHAEMVGALHAAAPRAPLTTTSFAKLAKPWTDADGSQSFGALPMLHLTQAHHFDSKPADATGCYSACMVQSWAEMARWATATWGRPFLVGEYGYGGDRFYPGTDGKGPALNRLNHHSTWSPVLLGGAAGGAMLWRMNWYFLPPDDFRANTRRFGDWLDDERPYLRQMDHTWAGVGLPGYWVGGYRKPNRAALYVLSKAARWEIEDSALTPIAGASYTLSGVPAGSYRVAYTDPLTGASRGTIDLAHPGGDLMLALPDVRRDLAIRVFDPAETPPAR
ncbi:MAG: hypothetical protein IT340_21050 [Chloroflexi bacterium]|nr:hypothetical protein [Chloroflexota bacterium]